MTCLVLRLEGALQSWGTSSRLGFRDSVSVPTLSGVLGLVSNALGLRRDEVLDASGVSMHVRVDVPGERLLDYYTAGTTTKIGTPSGGRSDGVQGHKVFLSGASFTVVLDGPEDVLGSWAGALRSPVRPLFLGRRSCPPSRPVFEALVGGCGADVVRAWGGPQREGTVYVESGDLADPIADIVYDIPLGDRRFGPRVVVQRGPVG